LTWLDRSGKPAGGAVVAENTLLYPQLSLDSGRVAVSRTVEGNADVWLMDLAREAQTRFTFDPAIDTVPVWSPTASESRSVQPETDPSICT